MKATCHLLETLLRRSMLALAAAGFALPGAVPAASTDIANAPLFTSSNTAVKPNLMFILDDSGSMDWDYLPDSSNFSSTKYGKKSYQCNGVAYNPDIQYPPPLDAAGNPLPNASLSLVTSNSNPSTQTTNQRDLAAITLMPTTDSGTFDVKVTSGSRNSSWYQNEQTVTVFQDNDSSRFFVGQVDSWDASTGLLRLKLDGGFHQGVGALTPARIGSGQPRSASYYRYTGTQRPLSYTYNSSGAITSTTFYRECNSTIGATPGSSVFTEVSVTPASTEAQKYANWSVYYSTRMTMMKSAISHAFATVDSRYRIGFSTIREKTATPGNNFLNIADFDASQKTAFYTAFNAAVPGDRTPLRGALSKAGQYFANKAPGQNRDPMQYSCQRNFTILSTDGYWNTEDERTSAPKYGPYKLDNSTLVGQQDGSGTLRPMLDGESATATTTERWTVTKVTTLDQSTPQTTTVAGTVSLTLTPAPSGAQRQTFSGLVKSFTEDNDGISRTGNVVTVTRSNHNLITGDTITVTGGSNSSIRGTNIPITRIDANTFKYTVPSGSGSVGGADYTITPTMASSCTGGYGIERTWVEVKNLTYATTRTVTTTNGTSTVVVTKTDSTPYTRTIVANDGVVTSDITGEGEATSSSKNGAATVTTSTPTSSAVTSSGTAAGTFTRILDFPITGTSCTGSATGTTSPTTFGSVTTLVLSNSTTTTTTSGTAVTTPTGTTSTESAHVTDEPATTSTGGVSDSLADVAAYYYKTDLRTSALNNCNGALGTDVCNNNVPGQASTDARLSFGDAGAWQHMSTYTLGLGVGGTLNFDPKYRKATAGDFIDIINRSKNWPLPGPDQSATNTDDLWHAAINGRGAYFSAGDPTSLAASLKDALDDIKATPGTASAASTSALQPVQGDNDVYVAQFKTQTWTGDVLSKKINPDTGSIDKVPTWSAKQKLKDETPASRTIYYPNPSGEEALRVFSYSNLTLDGYASYFDNFCSKRGASGSSAPEQCATLASTAAANDGNNLVAYLRGDQTLKYYRSREDVLGDIIGASPLFVGKPSFKYTENNYRSFAGMTRSQVVLAAANDGMLHAFDRETGKERWAYIPSFVMPNLYKLADAAYKNNHSFFVDGSPQMGDIYVGGANPSWKTIVVGGLNAGGRGYYALDVTDTLAPKLLWEFRHDDLGLSFCNPIITKMADGTWVVAFTSGYNNVSPGDGNGHLFILNAMNGALISKTSTFTSGTTPAGDTTTPSGLAELNVWVDAVENNSAKSFYGGDLQGNLWRFDIDGLVQPNRSALLLASLKTSSTTPQSITSKPALAEVLYNGVRYPVVYVATGRYLGATDLTSQTTQSIYAIKDPLTKNSWGDVRSANDFVTQTLTAGTDANGRPTRRISAQPVDWSTKAGWRVDYPVAGERTTINPLITLNTLTIGSIIPNNDTCTAGGSSFKYSYDVATGGSTTSNDLVGISVGDVLIQGLTNVQLADGSIVTIITRSDATLDTDITEAKTNPDNLRRTSWRELVD